MSRVNELPLHPVATGDEVLRLVKTKDGKLVISVAAVLLSEDPGTWGIALVDIAHHVANAFDGKLADEKGNMASREEILARIREMFDDEWDDRSDVVKRLTDD